MTVLVVAIDGPAGAGKSSVAKAVALRCGLTLVDTGAIYRTLAYVAHRDGVGGDDENALGNAAAKMHVTFLSVGAENRVFLDGEDVTAAIRGREVSLLASKVSRHPSVRTALLGVQRAFGAQGDGAVLEGRDIGTVVFPNAAVKVFLTASAEERARRRALELDQVGQTAPYDVILDEIRRRDQADMERPVAPLIEAADAVRVDSTMQTEWEVVNQIVSLVDNARGVA